MAYNPYTRLQLKFDETNGSTTTVDTSQTPKAVSFVGTGSVSSGAGRFSATSAVVGSPNDDGAEAPGCVSANSPDAVFTTDLSSARRIDFWFRIDDWPTGGNWTAPVEISAGDGDYALTLHINLFGDAVISLAYPDDGYSTSFSIDVSTFGVWRHVRFYFQGTQFRAGLDGVQVAWHSGSSNVWPGATGPVQFFGFGCDTASNNYLRGFIDNIEVLEGDTSWTGGSYTVPTAPPDSYGAVGVSGSGANTLAAVVSTGTGTYPPAEINGQGSATLGSISSTGGGDVRAQVVGSGANVVGSVTSSGIGGDITTAFDLRTTLMLHGNADGYLTDSSIYNQQTTPLNAISLNTTLPYFGTGSIRFPIPAASDAGELQFQLGRGVFFDNSTDKIFDFKIRYTANGQSNIQNLLFVNFDTYSIGLHLDTATQKLYFKVTTQGYSNNSNKAVSPATLAPNVTYDIRMAFIGPKAHLCLNGIQQVEITTPVTAWPTTEQPVKFQFGYAYAGFTGTLDELRVQEGSVANHGYAGGNYTPIGYEWGIGQRLFSGTNIVDNVTSSGDGLVIPLTIGEGANTLDSTANEGNANVGVFRTGVGANTLDGQVSVGSASTSPERFGTGDTETQPVTSTGQTSLQWIGRGANTTESITSGQGAPAEPIGVGSNIVDYVVSVGTGISVPALVQIQGAGQNATSVLSAGGGTVQTLGQGANTTDVASIGTGTTPNLASGANSTSVTSLGDGSIYTAATAANTFEVFGAGTGTVLIIGQGASQTEALTFHGGLPDPFSDGHESVHIREWLPHEFVKTSTPAIHVRTQ